MYFRFDNGAGQTREYKIELQENLRWIQSVDGNILTNPGVRCFEWTKNAIVEVNPPWDVDKLIHFYNNKWRALIKQPDIPNFPMATYGDHFFILNNNQGRL